jgi:RND superfamily putative drug exporter
MGRILSIAAGRRAKWVVLAVWLIVLFASFAAKLPNKFESAQKNESTSFLPASTESTKELKKQKALVGDETVASVVVFHRDGGLTAADRATIARDRAKLNGLASKYPQLEKNPRSGELFSTPVPSANGAGAITVGVIRTNGEGDTILDPVKAERALVSGDHDGLQVKITGSAGFSADAIKVFQGINGALLAAAALLVLVLLALIYRSPIFLWIPFGTVLVAEGVTRSLGYALTQVGVTVNGQSASILSVLVLGAGTDYALLLVARYREELRRHEDRHEALALALRSAGPAIVASAVTVMLALLSLSIAEVNGTAGLGPIGAMGIFVAMIAMLTLLPALLAIFGRGAFWPFVPRYGDEGADSTHGRWRSIGERVARRPRRTWMGAGTLLVLMALGLLAFNTNLTQTDSFRGKVESVEGQKLLAQDFPAGANAPTDVFVPPGAPVAKVAAALKGADGVAAVQPGAVAGPRGTLLSVTLKPEPYSTEAFDLIPRLRDTAKAAGGDAVLLGGPTAVEHDLRKASAHDTLTIIPIVLLIVLLTLIVLLRALTAPLLLIGTVVLSFAASLGFSSLIYKYVFDFVGSDPSLPLFVFVFLVALGIDYNIFLMARVREEALKHGTREGMLRGLAVTGGVITSAGVVLAGTFVVLAVLPLVFLTELGFAIAFGVLLDTLIVRSVLVPALVFDIGPKVWWPSTLSHSLHHRRGGDRDAPPGGGAPAEAAPTAEAGSGPAPTA